MKGIPIPFVRANQWFLVLSVLGVIIFKQYWILVVPFGLGLYSLITGRNPIFRLIPPFLRKPLSDYRMEDPDQQRFNQWIAVVCLALSLIFFMLGMPGFGFAFAGMVAVAALVAIMGFCVGCFIRFQFVRWKHRRKQKKTV
ncbi:DUF4395 domain-containing protein [Effusibacillus consociatus]|uniref:DUF4395 domain-containing protein n=1 Tax=Effusibacillus consociatus TaxID=1117041 RepID=A0ABV9Q6Z5_9BACL